MRSQLRGIVGLRLAISRIDGKAKFSQNRSAADRAGVVSALRADEDAAARAVADRVAALSRRCISLNSAGALHRFTYRSLRDR